MRTLQTKVLFLCHNKGVIEEEPAITRNGGMYSLICLKRILGKDIPFLFRRNYV